MAASTMHVDHYWETVSGTTNIGGYITTPKKAGWILTNAITVSPSGYGVIVAEYGSNGYILAYVGFTSSGLVLYTNQPVSVKVRWEKV